MSCQIHSHLRIPRATGWPEANIGPQTMFRLTMHFRIPCVAAVATAWMFACAQADPIGNLPPNTNPGSGGGSSEGGGKSTNGGKTSATGGAKTTDTVVERGGSSATEGGSSGEPS